MYATSLCGLEEWIISSHFGTIFTILFFWLFYYFLIGRWRSRGTRNEIRIGKAHKTDSKSCGPQERHCTKCWSTCTTHHIMFLTLFLVGKSRRCMCVFSALSSLVNTQKNSHSFEEATLKLTLKAYNFKPLCSLSSSKMLMM